MKKIYLSALPSVGAASDCLDFVRLAYGAASSLAGVVSGPYFYSFRACYLVPAGVDGWGALCSSLQRTGRGDWIY